MTVVGSIPIRGNELIIIYYYFHFFCLIPKQKRGDEFRHSLRKASKILRKVEKGVFLH